MLLNKDKVYFTNSIGDITAVNISNGKVIWQTPTQRNISSGSTYFLKLSDIVSDKNSVFVSNNNNQFFSINLNTGNFNWKNKINSNLRPTLVEDYLFSISLEGYLMVIEKNSGNIIRVTDIFNHFKPKKRNEVKPVGFIMGSKNIYLSTSNGRILIIDIASGKTISTLKIDNEKISRPFILDKDLFVITDNAIIKLN